MSKWDIDPAGVRSVVIKTGEVAKKLEGEAKSFGNHLQSAATASGSGLVAKALSDFATANSTVFQYMGDRTGKSLNGAVAATQAYMKGDMEMAAEAQKNAVKSPYADDLPPRMGGPR